MTETSMHVEHRYRPVAHVCAGEDATQLHVLTASIVHELTQPLTGILVNACTCSRLLERDPPDVDGARETAMLAVRDCTRAAELVRRFRALFAGRAVTTELVDLNDIAAEVSTRSCDALERDSITLRLELAPALPRVAGDPVLLRQVVSNLVQNAIEAMRDGAAHDRELVVRTDLDGDGVRLSVSDSGPGFDLADVDRSFEPFVTTRPSGMGLGLGISRAVVESHRGALHVASEEGAGATVSFRIPRSSPIAVPNEARTP